MAGYVEVPSATNCAPSQNYGYISYRGAGFGTVLGLGMGVYAANGGGD